jgi:hypothetical protein
MNLSDKAYEEITQKVNETDGYIFWHEEVRAIIETMQSMGYVIVHPIWSYENREPQWICECGWKSIELIKGPCHNCGSGAALRRI